MQARGPLMVEHRLIEKMLSAVKKKLEETQAINKIDPLFVDIAVDFIKTYADRTHHGKEEDILFRELKNKELTEEDKRVMKELIEEHVYGRKITNELVQANTKYRNGEKSSLVDIASGLQTLFEFYPKHIQKEDKVFFPSCRKYFTQEEEQDMLAEFWEFDRKMIHEKYKRVIDGLKA